MLGLPPPLHSVKPVEPTHTAPGSVKTILADTQHKFFKRGRWGSLVITRSVSSLELEAMGIWPSIVLCFEKRKSSSQYLPVCFTVRVSSYEFLSAAGGSYSYLTPSTDTIACTYEALGVDR